MGMAFSALTIIILNRYCIAFSGLNMWSRNHSRKEENEERIKKKKGGGALNVAQLDDKEIGSLLYNSGRKGKNSTDPS